MLSVKVIAGDWSQLSLAVGGVKFGTAGHEIVALGPAALKVGATLSITVMVWLTGADTLPQSSVALQVLFTE